MDRNSKGFTLIEVIVVIGIISMVSMLIMSVSIPQMQSDKTESTVSDLQSIIYLYEQNAASGLNDEGWGIKFASDSYTLFTGDTYGGSDEQEVVYLPENVSISQINLEGGTDEIVFLRGSFRPVAFGTIVLTDGTSSFVIEVNKEGLIRFEKI